MGCRDGIDRLTAGFRHIEVVHIAYIIGYSQEEGLHEMELGLDLHGHLHLEYLQHLKQN